MIPKSMSLPNPQVKDPVDKKARKEYSVKQSRLRE
jgi:hypothetical protein